MAESCDATLNPRPALRPTASEAKAILDAQDCPPASNPRDGQLRRSKSGDRGHLDREERLAPDEGGEHFRTVSRCLLRDLKFLVLM